MFELDQGQSWVESTAEDVVFLATSVNRPAVAPPDRRPEPAQAYILSVRRDNLFEVFIYLYLVTSNVGLLYKWDAGAVPRDLVNTLQQNALEFTETMGFMMSDLRYRQMSPTEKMDLFESTPVFFEDLSRFKTEEEIQEIEPEDVGESELVIEPIDEQGQDTITEGNFVFEAEQTPQPGPARAKAAAGEPGGLKGEEVEEIFLEGIERSATAAEEEPVVEEEDIALDNLEVEVEVEVETKKKAPVVKKPSPPPPQPEIVEEIKSKGDELLDALEAQDEGISRDYNAAPAANAVSPRAARVRPAPEPAPMEEEEIEEDIVLDGLIGDEGEEEPVAEAVAEEENEEEEEEPVVGDETQEMDIPPQAIIQERPAPSARPSARPAPAPAQIPGTSATRPAARPAAFEQGEDEFTSDDLNILISLLTMM